MTTQEKVKRILDIYDTMDELKRELAEIVSGGGEDILEGKEEAIGVIVPVSPTAAKRISETQKPVKGHACCGSKIYRHKSTCENAKKLAPPPQKVNKKQEEDEELRCGECEYKFIGKISGQCEKCGSTDIYRMPE